MDPATDETFTWTGATALSRAPQVERELDHVGEAIARTCESSFPRWAGYRIQEDRLQGSIRGRRYRISRRGFVAQVSVQLFAIGTGYRRDVGPPLRMRVDGRARLAPPAPPPRLPLVGITLGCGVLAVAGVLVGLGGYGWVEIDRAPSLSPMVDAMGIVTAALFVALALGLIEAVLRQGAAMPWAELRAELRSWLRWPGQRAADRRRWSSLHEQLASACAGWGQLEPDHSRRAAAAR